MKTVHKLLLEKWRHIIPTINIVVILLTVLLLNSAEIMGFEASEADLMEKKWGIRILGIRQSAAGYLLDFRYKVTDTKKAAPLFERKTKAYLLDQKSGVKFIVPKPAKIGPLRNTDTPKSGRNYVILFANTANYIKKGNKVSIVIGKFKAENLSVQ